MFRTALTLVMSSLAIPAVASMRCGTHLVDEGDSVEQVLERCGQPLSRIVNEPALRNNGVPKLNAARTEFWVYGPSGGVYRHLRFTMASWSRFGSSGSDTRLLRSYSYR